MSNKCEFREVGNEYNLDTKIKIKNGLSFFNSTSDLIYLSMRTPGDVDPVHLCNERIAA